jgi:hypothetical protein
MLNFIKMLLFSSIIRVIKSRNKLDGRGMWHIWKRGEVRARFCGET